MFDCQRARNGAESSQRCFFLSKTRLFNWKGGFNHSFVAMFVGEHGDFIKKKSESNQEANDESDNGAGMNQQ